MPNIEDNFYGNHIFTFNSFSCECVKDVNHTAPDEQPIETLKVLSNPSTPIKFGYKAKQGLSRIAENGTSEEDNILGSLISLTQKSESELFSFFKRNGFLFQISGVDYESINNSTLYELINRIKATVELMTAANEIKKDYQKIVYLTLYLLLSKSLKIQLETCRTEYTTCKHSFTDTLLKASGMSLSDERRQEEFNSDYFMVSDSVLENDYQLDVNLYNNVISGTDINGSISITPFYKDIMLLYCNYNGTNIERKIIDFLFHLNNECSQISAASEVSLLTEYNFNNLSDQMKKAVIEIANFVIGEEINANLNGIHPVYDIATMSPTWKIDSLLSALYFSLFYLNPDLELYRQCANPRCQTYFLVRTTSTRKKYCCQDCGNRVAQDRHRKRKREQNNK